MKKMIVMVAVGALMLVSCNNGLSEEGQKAWDNFKDLEATFESLEAADANYDSMEELNAGYEAFSEASTNMAQYVFQITEEQADSFKTICENCAAVYQQAQEMSQAADEIDEAADEFEDAADELDEAIEDVE